MAWSHVQTIGSNPTGTPTSTSATFPGAATAGNLVIVGVNEFSGSQPTVTDNLGNAYSLIKSGAVGAGTSYIFASTILTGGTLTVTATPPAACNIGITADEFAAGSGNTIALDGTPVGATANSTTPAAGSLPIAGNDLVFCFLAPLASQAVVTFTAGSGFTVGSSATKSGSNAPSASEYALNVTSGPSSPGWTLSASIFWMCLAAAWKATAAGGGPSFTPWIFGDQIESNTMG